MVVQSVITVCASKRVPSCREPLGSQGPIVKREKESIEAGARRQGKEETLKQGAFNFYITNPEAFITPSLEASICLQTWFALELLLGKPETATDLEGQRDG